MQEPSQQAHELSLQSMGLRQYIASGAFCWMAVATKMIILDHLNSRDFKFSHIFIKCNNEGETTNNCFCSLQVGQGR